MALSADVRRLREAAPDYAATMELYHVRNFILLVIDGATFAFAISLLSETTIIPAFVSALTSNPVLVGLVAALFAVGRYLPQLIGAHLVLGRSRRKPLFLAIVVAERFGILAIALSATLIGFVPPSVVLLVFFLSFTFYAVTTGLIGPVYGDFVAKGLPKARGWFFGIVQLLGGGLGFTAALWAERVLQDRGFPEGNQVLFWTSFALSMLSIGFVAALKEVDYPLAEARPPFIQTLRLIPSIIKDDQNYRSYLVARSVMALSTLGIGFVVVDGFTRGLTPPDAALLAAVFILSQAISGFVLGFVGNYWGWRIVVISGGFFLAGGMITSVLATSVTLYVVAFALLGSANAVTVIGDPNMSIEMADTRRTSVYIGTTSTLLAPFFIFGPLLAGVFVSTVGYTTIFITALFLSIASIFLALSVKEPRTHVGTGGERDVPTVAGQPGAQP